MDKVTSQLLFAGGLSKVPVGQILFDEENFTGTWTVPPGVMSISLVIVGRGGLGVYASAAGGGLIYANNFATIPGQVFNIKLQSDSTAITRGTGFKLEIMTPSKNTNHKHLSSGITSADYVYFNGGSGGMGGGGAGGYAGAGGDGGGTAQASGLSGAGGAGGGGGGSPAFGVYPPGGGGVGVYGQGASGVGGQSGYGGGGGSGGEPGSPGKGGAYGGGINGRGAIRIIWPGNLRQFPSTRTTDE